MWKTGITTKKTTTNTDLLIKFADSFGCLLFYFSKIW